LLIFVVVVGIVDIIPGVVGWWGQEAEVRMQNILTTESTEKQKDKSQITKSKLQVVRAAHHPEPSRKPNPKFKFSKKQSLDRWDL